MARITSRLHHHHAHASAANDGFGLIHQSASDPFALIVWIDGHHINLPHPIFWMKAQAHKSGQCSALFCNPYPLALAVEEGRDIALLANIPALRVKGVIGEG